MSKQTLYLFLEISIMLMNFSPLLMNVYLQYSSCHYINQEIDMIDEIYMKRKTDMNKKEKRIDIVENETTGSLAIQTFTKCTNEIKGP